MSPTPFAHDTDHGGIIRLSFAIKSSGAPLGPYTAKVFLLPAHPHPLASFQSRPSTLRFPYPTVNRLDPKSSLYSLLQGQEQKTDLQCRHNCRDDCCLRRPRAGCAPEARLGVDWPRLPPQGQFACKDLGKLYNQARRAFAEAMPALPPPRPHSQACPKTA